MTDDTEFTPFERETTDHMAFIRRLAEAETEALSENGFAPKILFHTDADEVRAVCFPEIDNTMVSRQKIAWTMTVLSAAIDNLWSMAWVADTCIAKEMTKTDGTKWDTGEMQYAFENNTVDAALVTEALTYQIMEGDRMSIATVPYKRENGTVVFDWDEARCETEEPGGEKMWGGFFPDAMKEAFGVPKVMAMSEAAEMSEALGLDFERARLHTLCAAVKIVMDQTEWPVLVPCKNEEEAEVFKLSFDQENPFNGHRYRVFDQDDVAEIDNLESAFALDSDLPNPNQR